MREAEIQKQIVDTYHNHPRVRLWRQNTGAAKIGTRYVVFGLKGAADLTGIIAPSGRALYIEVKSATGRQRPEQVAFERMVTKFGAIYVLARDVDTVRAALAAEGVES